MHIEYGHWHVVIDLVIHQEHYPVADLELVQVLVPEHVEHLVGAQVPHSEALVNAVLRHHLAVQVVDLHEVGELESKVFEEAPPICVSRLKVLDRDRAALH